MGTPLTMDWIVNHLILGLMEDNRTFRITYGNKFVCNMLARTSYEAIDRTYNKYIGEFSHLSRKKINAKKLR